MKILAIRLKNLASLAGPVELDFTIEPLASAGLFAITGPTGAGKSTLLDALCLALFGSVPRLGDTGRDTKVPDVDGDIATGDPRNLLRRGAGAGFAEVDFIGVDGVRYRARWEANRAREKAGGKLQPSRQTLLDLDSDRLLATQKGEYRPLLESRLGLNFEQFTRAVLLAQSEFSAFLKADDNERSELLEKLTDTAVYSRLGRRAYDKARAARQQLEALQAQEGAFSAMGEAERLALDARLDEARQGLLQSQGQRREREAQHEHYQARERLTAERAAAADALAQARLRWDQLSDDRQDLAHLDALAPQRALLERQARLTTQLATLGPACTEAAGLLDYAQQASTQAQAELEAADSHLQAALASHGEATPALREAFDQQAALHHLEQDLAPQQARQAQLERQHLEGEQTLATLAQAQRQAADVQQAIGARLEQSTELARLADAWQGYQPRLQQLVEVASRVSRLDAQLPPFQEAARVAGQARASAQALLDDLQARLGATDDLGERLQLLSELIRDNRTALEELGTLEGQWRRCAEVQERLSELAAQQHRLAQQREQRTTEGKAVSTEHQAASQALDVTVQLLERQHLARLKAGLIPGAPCPVCGSAEHPSHGASSDSVLETLEAQDLADMQAAQDKVKALADRLAELRAEVRGLMEQQKALHEQQQRGEAHNTTLLDALKALPRHDALLAVPAAGRQAWLSEGLARLREQIGTDENQLKALLAAQAQATQQQNDLRAAQQVAAEAERAAQAAQDQRTREQARFDEELEAFTGLLPDGVLKDLRTGPAKAVAALEASLAERLGLLEQQHAQALAQGQRQQQIQVCEAQQQGLAQQLEALRDGLQGLQARREQLRVGLAERLGAHASAQAWQTVLEQAVEAARIRHAEAAQALQRAGSEVLAAQARQQALLDQQAAVEAELAELGASLLGWRTTCPTLDDPALKRLLAVSPEEVEQLRARLREAQSAVENAQVLLQEREQRLEAHVAQASADALDAQALAVALATITAECERQEQACAELRAAQLEDDRRRQAREALAAQLEAAQAEYRRWGRLSALIGSAEGDRLRKIAQAYNLDLLIRHANAQLLQLVRRYRLKRGGSALGLLVVDTEMGDEVRSVHSLSGGETFLVSLALALGLASMASSTLRIESLFIDEGFGSLDPESLQLAMDALDNLQAQGRKVAVISHVQEMHERIPVQIQVRRHGNGLSEVTVVP
ncbi:AAA family ATPase [Pseudomonas japonica]|uniref:AAA family ATPase n=1 Tax=Pseudomonas japonica TaxID=256466 RepID=UPI0015E3E4B1|nr:AAA family ATPase [Pseudomonas japonica]MBA1289743.1 AAA family ATPase [Pseudomonas japonica]